MTRFKVDENLPPFIAQRLRDAGFDAMTVAEQQLTGTPDERLAPICASEDRVLVTLDLGFSDVRAYPPGSGPGFVVLRPAKQDRQGFEEACELILRALEESPVAGALWMVEPGRVRVRDRPVG